MFSCVLLLLRWYRSGDQWIGSEKYKNYFSSFFIYDVFCHSNQKDIFTPKYANFNLLNLFKSCYSLY